MGRSSQEKKEVLLEIKTLSVKVDSEFPRIIQYKHKASGKTIAEPVIFYRRKCAGLNHDV